MRRVVSLVVCAMLVGCGGGGGTGAAVPSPPDRNASATATFVVKVPARAVSSSSRQPHYITSNVQAIDFTVTQAANSSVGAYVFYPLTPQATYCASGASGLTCTLQVNAPPGSDTFVVRLYDQTETGLGYVVSTGTVTQTINAQASNTINVITDAVPTFITLGVTNPFPASGAAGSIPLNLTISDPDGNIIVGSFGAQLLMKTTDTSGAISFSKATLNQASDATGLTLNYTAAATGVSYAYVTEPPSLLVNSYVPPSSGQMPFDPGFVGPVASPASLYFAHATSAAQTVTMTGANGATAPFTVSATAGPYGSCGANVTVSGSSPTFTITPTSATFAAMPVNTVGFCYLTATSSNSAVLPIPVMISP